MNEKSRRCKRKVLKNMNYKISLKEYNFKCDEIFFGIIGIYKDKIWAIK